MLLLLIIACSPATWTVTTWGEDYIEEGIPAEAFADGCELRFDRFAVNITEASLLDGNGVVGEAPEALVDLTLPGPHTLGEVEVPAGTYAEARFVISGGPAVEAAGLLTCGARSASFDWRFDTDTTYLCAPEGLTLAAGGAGATELTVHGDHLFYDDLVSPDAEVRGEALLDADADADGDLTLEELAEVPVAPLGYGVGPYSEVSDLRGFVTHLTRTLGHVDGEGHCEVDL
ncbi:MAG: hypothetical protein H6741_04955 [Alphaproteobacteria bacterium]|nr:hypothetical protein [Alphaproteobacteria bacterium]